MTQAERIRKYLDEKGSISPMEAFMHLGITKLATRISEMIRDGEKIQKIPEKGIDRYGGTVSYMRYKKAV